MSAAVGTGAGFALSKVAHGLTRRLVGVNFASHFQYAPGRGGC